MEDTERNRILDLLAEHALRIESAKQLEQVDSLTVATATTRLYEDRDWVDEFLTVKPEPARPSGRWKADSFSRFTQWARWKADQTGRQSLGGRYLYQLRDAAVIAGHLEGQVPNLSTAQIREEYRLRPLKWLVKEGYEHRIGEVWAIAIAEAGSAEAVDSRVMREAVAEWKRRTFPPNTGKGPRTARAKQLRVKAYSSIHELIELARRDPKAKAELDLLWKQAKLDMEQGRWVSGDEAEKALAS